MKKIVILSAVMLTGFFRAQSGLSSGENYVYTKTYLSEDGTKKSETVQYFDELGRAKQIISIKGSPSGKDLVIPVVYDELGRQTKDILPVPVPTANGAIQSVSEASANAYYGVPNAFSEKKLEASPLGRLLEAAHPGSEWAMGSGHTQKMGYDVNTVADGVKRYTVTHSWQNATGIVSVPSVSFYGENMLFKNTVTDENGNKETEFKNTRGQTVLVRKSDGGGKLDTYYIYDDYDRLVYVISPKADQLVGTNGNVVTEQILDDLCYRYRYDNKNREVEKKLPGKGWEYSVYDLQDRPVASQDANLREKNQWLYTKYDQFGRAVITGISTGGTRNAEQTVADALGTNNAKRTGFVFFIRQGMDVYYDPNGTYPNVNWVTLLSVNYFDDYTPEAPARPSAVYGKATLGAVPVQFSANGVTTYRSLKGMPVSSYVKNIDDDNWTRSHIWYDAYGRAVGSYSINHLGGYTKTETQLDFSGMVKQTKTYHKRVDTDAEKTITETFEYDNQNRLLVHKHKIDNNAEEVLSQNTYDDLGRLTIKKVGNTLASPLQTVNYTYNIRGWLTGINDPDNLGPDLFGYKIKYSQVEGLETPDTSDPNLKVKPQYNGNIAEVDWKSAAQANEPLKRYGYVYDDMNRLLAGFYQNSTNPSLREFYEKVTYDPNGNINTMKRTAGRMGSTALLIDNMSYQYENAGASNRLQKITESVTIAQGYPYKAVPTNIGYDANGNTTSFPDKGISSIRYNYLNLPERITQNAKVTDYAYRADGVKVKKIFGNVETLYLDGFQYKSTYPSETDGYIDDSQPSEMKLRIIPTAEGYYDALKGRYYYNYTDHLGNVRLSYSDADGNGVVTGDIVVSNCTDTPDGQICNNYIITGEAEGVNNYYPFGLLHNSQYNNFENVYQYGYNGKELQETGMNDYGARMYMNDIGRWGVIDPLAEATRRFSPYVYGNNNPIVFTDPDGRISKSFLNSMMNSAGSDTTTWHNTGDGFESDEGVKIGYEGNYISLNTFLDADVSSDPNSGGGAVAGTINLAPINLSGSSTFFLGMQVQAHHNAFMERWNNHSDFLWDRMANAGRYNDGPIKMIGGMGDPAGLFDIGGQVISTWEPKNQYLAMAVGIFGAIALKKPGLAGAEIQAEKGILINSGITKKGVLKADYLFENINDAKNFGASVLGPSKTRMYDASGKWIGWENKSGGQVYWGHGDWGKGVGSSTFPHLNYNINGQKGHLFLYNKIINRGQGSAFQTYFNLGN